MPAHPDTGFSDPLHLLAPACEVEVLILTRDGALISQVQSALEGAYRVQHARRAALAIDMLTERNVGVLITDAPAERVAFQDLVPQLRQRFPDLLIVGVGDRDAAVSLIELFNDGLVDRILLKPLSVDQVRQQVQSAVRQHLRSRGAGGNVEVSAAPEEPPDWDVDNTEPQSDVWLAEVRPDESLAEPRSDLVLAEPRSDVSLQTSLPALWRAQSLPAANSALRRPLLIGGSGAAAVVAAFVLTLVLQGGEEAGRRGLVGGDAAPATRALVSAKSSDEVQRALEAASVALRERRYISPAEDNALDHYRAVLEIEPDHAKATAGLDTIAGALLQQAQSALSENNLEDALAARRIARDLRPAHPAILFVDAEFADYGKSLIASMDLALAPDDLSGTSEQLDVAARFLPPDSPDLAAARAGLVERFDQLAINDRLALANERIEANNLTVPKNDSAEFHLLALQADYPEDENVINGLERLAAMMLKRTDAAILEKDVETARRWLNKADELGVRAEASTARREAFANIARQTAATEAMLNEEAALAEAALREELALAEAALIEEAALAAAASEPMDAGRRNVAAGEPVRVASLTPVSVDSEAGAGAEIIAATVEINELEILRMVEPEYPRRAYVRDIDGWVDLEFTVTETGLTRAIEVTGAKARGWFERAAIEAIGQWQFQPELQNGQPVERRAKVRLQFTPED